MTKAKTLTSVISNVKSSTCSGQYLLSERKTKLSKQSEKTNPENVVFIKTNIKVSGKSNIKNLFDFISKNISDGYNDGALLTNDGNFVSWKYSTKSLARKVRVTKPRIPDSVDVDLKRRLKKLKEKE